MKIANNFTNKVKEKEIKAMLTEYTYQNCEKLIFLLNSNSNRILFKVLYGHNF